MNEPKQETFLKDFVNIMTAKKQFSNDTWQHWLLAVSMWVFLVASIIAIFNVSFFINHLNRL
jgi:hypothetical protein